MRLRHLAVLRGVPRGARAARSAVVRAVRPPLARHGRSLSGLPASARGVRSFAVPVRGAGARGDPPAEVLGMAERGGRARRRHGGGRAADRGRGHVGTARAAPLGRTWVRPSSRARRGGGQPTRPAGPSTRAAIRGDRPPGATPGCRTTCGHARRVRAGPSNGSRSAPRHRGRRRLDDGSDGGGMRRCARARGRPRSRGADGGTRVRGTGAWLYSNGLSTGSVVARGSSPVVDASRGRNDPRKATIGRPSMARFRCKSCPGTGDRSGRRR